MSHSWLWHFGFETKNVTLWVSPTPTFAEKPIPLSNSISYQYIGIRANVLPVESILNNIKSINSVNSENIVGNIHYIARCYLHPSQCPTYLLTLVFFSLRTTKHLVSRDAAGSKEQWTIPIMASAQQQSILRDYILFKTNIFLIPFPFHFSNISSFLTIVLILRRLFRFKSR